MVHGGWRIVAPQTHKRCIVAFVSRVVKIDPRLVELREGENLKLEPRYASTNNICHKILYSEPRLWIHKKTLPKLIQAKQTAKTQNLQLWIWDAYRPPEVQKQLWNACPDPRYVANPQTGGSLHARGVALDLTLARNKKPLDCGSDFDHMGNAAHWDAYDAGLISAAQQENRLLLRSLMQDAGFETIATEWWHWQLPSPKNSPWEILPSPYQP